MVPALILLAVLAGCGGSSPTSSSTSVNVATNASTPTPTPLPTASPTAPPTPTPPPSCSISLSSATFEPQRVSCPAGSSRQTVRVVFDATAGGAGSNLGELIYGALYVNTSCGAAQELSVTNTLSIG